MKTDYRETKLSENVYSDVKNKKKELLSKIKKKHPKAKDIYKIVSSSNTVFHSGFMDVYHCKCAYCGISNRIIPSSDFEIDHVICKKSPFFIKNTTKSANGIANLVLACRTCNRKKSDFDLSSPLAQCLHPDNPLITQVFTRDDEYNIHIAESYSGNAVVEEFYKQIALGEGIHQLDYVLMSLFDLRDIYPNIHEISEAITILLERRNFIA